MKELSKRFKQIRLLLNLSQTQIANVMKISKQAISNIETGKSYPSIALMAKLAKDYNINLNYLILGVGATYRDETQQNSQIRKEILQEVESYLDERGIK